MNIAGSNDGKGTARLVLSRRLFFGRLAEELSDLIAKQSAEAFDDFGIVIPPRSCSLMVAAEALEPASAQSLATALDRSHQLVSQKLPKLLQLGLLEWEKDPADSRQKLYRLTEAGREQMVLFRQIQVKIEAAYEDLDRETAASEAESVSGIIAAALEALSKRPLKDRM